MQRKPVFRLAISSPEEFVFGRAPHPVRCGRGLELGAGTVIPELNFTLPPMRIAEDTWSEVRRQYQEMVEGVCARAAELEAPGLLVEFETLPPMTVRPEWGAELTRLLADALRNVNARRGLPTALRLTPNDTREHERPPLMRRGRYWENMRRLFDSAAASGADLLAIESTGGKEVHDEALVNADLAGCVFALGVLGARDMEFLWGELVEVCRRTGIVPSGDTACGFGNTAMVLAEKRLIPRLFAAVIRAATVPRSLTAYEMGATGPGKDCGYENPYLKALAGVPISMEGRAAACAHLSPVGNIAQAVCDAWSNESVPNVRLLSAGAPVVSIEHLTYDCRLLNAAQQAGEAFKLRDWLVASDAALDPQAYVLRPDVVLRIAAEIVKFPSPYARTCAAVRAALRELRDAHAGGRLRLPARELRWLDSLQSQADELPDSETGLLSQIQSTPLGAKFLPAEYGL
jgi:methanol--5-hydroxybenzimidazolylcobamide Co-methyltransferase